METQKITPYLWFDNNAEEAINYYISVFRNGKILDKLQNGDQLLGATFELNGQKFMALNGGPRFKFTEAISFYVNCETQEEIDYLWGKLSSEGGQESMCGWVKDKYGLWWQVIPPILGRLLGHEERDKATRAMQAMLKMKKIDIQKLKDAFDGK